MHISYEYKHLPRYKGRLMSIIFTTQHPAHVHLFKNTIQKLIQDGEDVFVFARDKGITADLLSAYEISYKVLAGNAESLFELLKEQVYYETRLLKHALKIDPDVMVAMGEPAVAHIASIIGAKSMIFTDTEHATLQNKLSFPFSDRIYTPECYQDNIGEKQIQYSGYHELAYLHPENFSPSTNIVNKFDINPSEKYVVLRLVSWKAAHDQGEEGFNSVLNVVRRLEQTGANVLITSEGSVPAELESYQLTIPAEKIHHILNYANLFIGESATMAAESAVLGTPAVYVSSIKLGYLIELEKKYNLVYNYNGSRKQINALNKSVEILKSSKKEKWKNNHAKLINDKINTAKYITNEIISETDDYQ